MAQVMILIESLGLLLGQGLAQVLLLMVFQYMKGRGYLQMLNYFF